MNTYIKKAALSILVLASCAQSGNVFASETATTLPGGFSVHYSPTHIIALTFVAGYYGLKNVFKSFEDENYACQAKLNSHRLDWLPEVPVNKEEQEENIKKAQISAEKYKSWKPYITLLKGLEPAATIATYCTTWDLIYKYLFDL